MSNKTTNLAVAVSNSVVRHLDELQRWGADFRLNRNSEQTTELVFNDGLRVVIHISNATPVAAKEPKP